MASVVIVQLRLVYIIPFHHFAVVVTTQRRHVTAKSVASQISNSLLAYKPLCAVACAMYKPLCAVVACAMYKPLCAVACAMYKPLSISHCVQ